MRIVDAQLQGIMEWAGYHMETWTEYMEDGSCRLATYRRRLPDRRAAKRPDGRCGR